MKYIWILLARVEGHNEMINSNRVDNCYVSLFMGGVDTERKVDRKRNNVILLPYGIFSTGINIKIPTMLFCFPLSLVNKNFQSLEVQKRQ